VSDAKKIAVIPGDGIGPEVIREAVKAARAAAAVTGARLEFTEFDWGADKYLREGVALPPGALPMLSDNFDAILFGAVGDPRVPDNRHAAEILLALRFKLDLYVNLRPARLLDRRLCPLRDATEADVNFTVIRENTEGLYAGMGGCFKKDTPDEIATQEDVNTRKGVERIIRYAFDYAKQHGLGKVCMADKSNVLTYGHGLWQRVFKVVSAEYPQIAARHLYADTLAMEMVLRPAQFEVIVTCNMFGDLLTDLAAALEGGLGLVASGNIHPGGIGLFEPVHGSAPPLAGKNVANPIGAIRTASLMLRHLSLEPAASAIDAAVLSAVREKCCTADIGGTLGTAEAGDWVAAEITNQKSQIKDHK
jgi:3-isopropylmalate dehydrogenase